MAEEFTQAKLAALYADGNYAMMLADPVEYPRGSGKRSVYYVEMRWDARQARWDVCSYGAFSADEQGQRLAIFLARRPQATLVAGPLPDGACGRVVELLRETTTNKAGDLLAHHVRRRGGRRGRT